MENVLVRENQILEKEIDFMDFTSFIMCHGIQLEKEMIYMSADQLEKGIFDNAIVANGEKENWDALEKLINMDYRKMEEVFETVEFKDNENTVIARIGTQEIAILVA